VTQVAVESILVIGVGRYGFRADSEVATHERSSHAEQVPTTPRHQEIRQIAEGEAGSQTRQEADETRRHLTAARAAIDFQVAGSACWALALGLLGHCRRAEFLGFLLEVSGNACRAGFLVAISFVGFGLMRMVILSGSGLVRI
jgi:hypothetical protein